MRVFGENSGGLFGTRQACRDPRSKKLEGNSERIFRYLRDLGENFGEKPSPGHGRLKFAILGGCERRSGTWYSLQDVLRSAGARRSSLLRNTTGGTGS